VNAVTIISFLLIFLFSLVLANLGRGAIGDVLGSIEARPKHSVAQREARERPISRLGLAARLRTVLCLEGWYGFALERHHIVILSCQHHVMLTVLKLGAIVESDCETFRTRNLAAKAATLPNDSANLALVI